MSGGQRFGRNSFPRKRSSNSRNCKNRPSYQSRSNDRYRSESRNVSRETSRQINQSPSSFRSWYKRNVSHAELVQAKHKLRELGLYNPVRVDKSNGYTVTVEAQMNSNWVSSAFVAALRTFQEKARSDNQLQKVDGLLGPNSKRVLFGASAPTTVDRPANAHVAPANPGGRPNTYTVRPPQTHNNVPSYGTTTSPGALPGGGSLPSPGRIPMRQDPERRFVSPQVIAMNKRISEQIRKHPKREKSAIVQSIFNHPDKIHDFVPFHYVLEEIYNHQNGRRSRFVNPFDGSGTFKWNDLWRPSKDQYGVHPGQRIFANSGKGGIALTSNKFVRTLMSNPTLTAKVYRYVEAQGSFEDYAKQQNIVSFLLKGDGVISRSELTHFLCDFDNSGVVSAKVNSLLPEGTAFNRLDSQSYSFGEIVTFIRDAAKAGGYRMRGAFPSTMQGVCELMLFDPALKRAFTSGANILAKANQGLNDIMSQRPKYDSIDQYDHVQNQLQKIGCHLERELTDIEREKCVDYLSQAWDNSFDSYAIMRECQQRCSNETEARAMYNRICSPEFKKLQIDKMIHFEGAAIYKAACACTGPGVAMVWGKKIGPNSNTKLHFGFSGAMSGSPKGKTSAGASLGVNFMPVLGISHTHEVNDYVYLNFGAAITPLGASAGMSIKAYVDKQYSTLGQNLGTVGRGGANYVTLGVGISAGGPGASIELGRDMLKEVELLQKDVKNILLTSYGHISHTDEIELSPLVGGEHCYCDSSAAGFIRRSLKGGLEALGYNYAPPVEKAEMMARTADAIAQLASGMRAEQYEGKTRLSALSFGISAGGFGFGIKTSKLLVDYYRDESSRANLNHRLRTMQGKDLLTEMREETGRGWNLATNIAKEWNNRSEAPRVTGMMTPESKVRLQAAQGLKIRQIFPGQAPVERSVCEFFPGEYQPVVVDIARVMGPNGRHVSGRGIPTIILRPARTYRTIRCECAGEKFNSQNKQGRDALVDHLNGRKYDGEQTKTKENNYKNEYLWEAVNSMSSKQCINLLIKPESADLVSAAFHAVVYRLSRDPSALQNCTPKQKLALIQNTGVQGKFTLLTENFASDPEGRKNARAAFVMSTIDEWKGPANNYAMLLEALQYANLSNKNDVDKLYAKGLQEPAFMDFLASYFVARRENLHQSANLARLYPALKKIVDQKTSKLEKIKQKKTPEHIYIIAPSSYKGHKDLAGMYKLAASDPRISIAFCDTPDQVSALSNKHGSIGLIAFGEPWDMNTMLDGAKLDNVDHLFTRSCRTQKEWMINTRANYPDMCVTVNDHTGYTKSNDIVAQAFATGLLDTGKKTHADVFSEVAKTPHAYGGDYARHMTFPHDDVSEAIRLMDPQYFDPQASSQMSSKAKGRGAKATFKTVSRTIDNKVLIIRGDEQAYQERHQIERAFAIFIPRSADSSGTPERPGTPEGPDSPEVPDTPTNPGNPGAGSNIGGGVAPGGSSGAPSFTAPPSTGPQIPGVTPSQGSFGGGGSGPNLGNNNF